MQIRWLRRKCFWHLPIKGTENRFIDREFLPNQIIIYEENFKLTLLRDDVSIYFAPIDFANFSPSNDEMGCRPFRWNFINFINLWNFDPRV